MALILEEEYGFTAYEAGFTISITLLSCIPARLLWQHFAFEDHGRATFVHWSSFTCALLACCLHPGFQRIVSTVVPSKMALLATYCSLVIPDILMFGLFSMSGGLYTSWALRFAARDASGRWTTSHVTTLQSIIGNFARWMGSVASRMILDVLGRARYSASLAFSSLVLLVVLHKFVSPRLQIIMGGTKLIVIV
jgi:hypothetical protein